MPTLNQNVLLNGKIVPRGKSISAANVKKHGLGDHLFDKESKATKPVTEDSDKGSEPDDSSGVDDNTEE